MIRRCERVDGLYIEKVYGQHRYAFGRTDATADLEDLVGWAERGGYPGNEVRLYDLETGRVYIPFEKERNVALSEPFYADGFFYLLRGDWNRRKIGLYRCLPWKTLERVTELDADQVEMRNLRILGNPVYIVSRGPEDLFRCYYPQSFSFRLGPNECVCFLEDGKAYGEAWVEEGWDDERERPGPAYRYYHRVIVRDLQGKVLSDQVGSLCQAQDGVWWIA